MNEPNTEPNDPERWDTTVHTGRRTDDRRNKMYGRTVEITIDPKRPAVESTVRAYVGERVSNVGELNGVRYEREGVSIGGYFVQGYTACTFRFFIPADKPSKIISEDDALAWGERLVPTLREAVAKGVADAATHAHREKVTEDATRIARWIGGCAVDAAEKAVRYKQRLAALKAELDAEISVQLSELVDGEQRASIDKAIAEEVERRAATDKPMSEEAVTFGFEHAGDYAKAPGPFGFRSTPQQLNVTDLYPEEEED